MNRQKRSYERFKIVCSTCSKGFTVPSCRKDTAKYCSIECKHESQRKDYPVVSCMVCATIFRKDWRYNRNGGDRHFCSHTCYISVLSNTTEVSCNQCEQMHTVAISKFRRNINFYCSDECRMKNLTGTVGFKSNLDYERFARKIRYSLTYLQWRKAVLQLYPACVECRQTQNLVVHHRRSLASIIYEVTDGSFTDDMIPKVLSHPLLSDPTNGATLCRTHHCELHFHER